MNEKNAPYDPAYTSRLMRINADIIMDEISAHVDKELERFSYGVEYMQKQARKIIQERDVKEEKDSW